ncbi:MFS transporter [Stachybotrys elegans]|uniref:MFS transporter n=1 Tax=Stachybotrys elegans TaxID=80388 RepID=A0A8K0WUF5_9HYPO|nr:MFS transporter [Stachybotrys elegans]
MTANSRGSTDNFELQDTHHGLDRPDNASANRLDKTDTPKELNAPSVDELVPADDSAEDTTEYPSASAVALLTIGLCLVSFTTALDNTIISTAIPKITEEFRSPNDVGWYGSAYLLSQTALQPTFGKVYSNFNIKWTYLIALVVFEAASVVCAAAPSSVVLIIGRAIAGIGGAALYSGGLNIIALVTPVSKRPLYYGILTSMFGVASVAGPLMGGAFTDRLSWRWCFWINLPVGGVAFAVVLFVLRVSPRSSGSGSGAPLTVMQKLGRLDLPGAALFIPAVVCLLLALSWGGISYPWSDGRVWGTLLCFAVMILLFCGWQVWKGDEATIPPRVITQKTVLASALVISLLPLGLYVHFYYLAFYFQVVQGVNAINSGLRTIPYLVSLTTLSVICGATMNMVGYYTPFAWVGTAIFTAGAGTIATLRVGSPSREWIGYQVLAGSGAGIALQVPFVAVQCVLASQDIPTGNGIIGFFNSLGPSIGISIGQNLYITSLRDHLTNIAGLDAETLIHSGATLTRDLTPPELLPQVLQAFNQAVRSTSFLAIASGAASFFASLLLEWKSVKGAAPVAHGLG